MAARCAPRGPGATRAWSPTWTSTCRPTSNALLPLVAPLLSGHSDVAIGTRLARGARIQRGAKREMISRSYNRCSGPRARPVPDAQCGFKAVRTRARALFPQSATKVVLRHRAAGPRAAERHADPRGARGLDR